MEEKEKMIPAKAEQQEKKPFGIAENLVVYYAETCLMILIGQIAGGILIGIVTGVFWVVSPELAQSGEWYTGSTYFTFVGIWLIAALFFGLSKKNRFILEKAGTALPGNRWSLLLLGILIGFVLNGVCVLTAWLHQDIVLSYDAFRPVSFVFIFFAVFVQSSAEEFLCRGFLYQKLLQRYQKPVVAIVGNSLLFALLHLTNSGVTLLSVLNIFLVGVLFSLIVYYTNSLWCAFAVHAAWNFMQNIIFGLPNSGMTLPYSVFKLDANTARNSFAYDVGFGIEGSLMAAIVILAACIIIYFLSRKFKMQQTV